MESVNNENERIDPFRKFYKPLSDAEISFMGTIKDHARDLYFLIDSCPISHDNRMNSLAKTKLEEAVMWAVKSITG